MSTNGNNYPVGDNSFPLKVTDLAIQQIIDARAADDDIDDSCGIRVACQSGGCAGFKHTLDFDTETEEGDLIKSFDHGDQSINIMIDEFSVLYLEGVYLDYGMGEWGEGFKFIGGDRLKKSCACGQSVCYT